MEFKQLRSFVEVMHQGGFTQAAKTLHISQSAVSKQVAQLEQSLGTALLERQGSQLRLTAAGSVVLQRAEGMLRLRNELLSELDDLSQLARGELRLGLPLLGSDALFAGLFAEYRRRYPNISIQLLEGGSLNIEQAVLSGELELGGGLLTKDPPEELSGSTNVDINDKQQYFIGGDVGGPIFGELVDKQVYVPLTTYNRLFGRNLDLEIHGKGSARQTFQVTITSSAPYNRSIWVQSVSSGFSARACSAAIAACTW